MLVCAHGPFRSFLEEQVPLVRNKFWPTLWCFESRAQTIIASLLRSRILPLINYRREILTLSDGGEVALDWAEEGCSVTSPIVIILPGLTGASQAEYIKCLVSSAKKVGIRCVIFNNRGLGGVELKTPRMYCAANSDDLSEVIEHVKKIYPHVPLGATGISMGGLILGNYLAQQGVMARNKLRGCFLISVPWNVFAATKNTEENYFNLMINKYLAGTLRKNIQRLHYSSETGMFDVDIELLLKSQTVREFDSHFTVKQFGYKDVEEYYSNATIHDKLHLIDVPLLCLSAADDPFQPVHAIPLKEISETKNVAVVVTSRGGHIGFLEGVWPVKEEQYMGKLFSQFFAALFITDVDRQVL
ncbi:abhydrolase domain containing Hydr1 isoform X2 [Osmia lignaria lignaria]|nr:phospholipase ABHD3 isoform X2 [Osmia lignaria]XP_034181994.1 phospholipase ABHD3 isoform X2 [Osmia lignaria]XP_034181995.1 phospholipase ABHD3 isoform X2 [Osmia lignaria]XP_034181996.1 phospholipase ABHD3 isoform X2 [Osmia lignaria]XP_034181997.1 phospholipase ABHD3 isoform X2 [Osmia lignaria]XP_034181999.1 phospholipase ABHD3 isoform X2 [Osmia lignaria]